MRGAAALALALALLVLGSAVWAQLVVPPSTLVRIEGYIGAKSPEPNLLATWRINRNRDVYDLHVTQLLVLTGTVRPGDIIVGLRPFSPALSLLGNLNALQAFVTTPPNQKVAITGYLHIEPPVRELILSTVEAIEAPTPKPTA